MVTAASGTPRKKGIQSAIESQAGNASQTGADKQPSAQPRIVVFIRAGADASYAGQQTFHETAKTGLVKMDIMAVEC